MKTAFKIVFFIMGVLLLLVGALFKLQHWPGGGYTLLAGQIFYGVFVLICGYELYRLDRIPVVVKILWLIALLILPFFAGIAYMVYYGVQSKKRRHEQIYFDVTQKR